MIQSFFGFWKTRKVTTGAEVLLLAITGWVLVLITNAIARDEHVAFLTTFRSQIVSGEVAIIGVVIVEVVGRAFVRHFRERGIVQVGLAVRGGLRVVGYLVVFLSVVSILAANPTLAVSLGTVMGVVVGLSSQSFIGNALAGTIVVMTNTIKLGSEVSVGGVTGRIVRFGGMHTILDMGEREALVPNTLLLTSVVQRRKWQQGRPPSAAVDPDQPVG